MAWTAPSTWTNVMLTAAQLNQQLRDNLLTLRQGNQQLVKLYLDSDASITNSLDTILSWSNPPSFQVGTIWSAANPTRLTAPVTGYYLIIPNIEWLSNSSGVRNTFYRWSVGAAQYELQSQGASLSGHSNCSGIGIHFLTAAQYVEIGVWQDSGATRQVHGGTLDRTRVAMMLLGT